MLVDWALMVRFPISPLMRYNGAATLKDYLQEYRLDYTFYSDPDIGCRYFPRGLVFLMAFWSGPSALSLKKTATALTNAQLAEDFEFVIFDLDGSEWLVKDIHPHRLEIGGNGEGLWIHNGEILEATNLQHETPESLAELIQKHNLS